MNGTSQVGTIGDEGHGTRVLGNGEARTIISHRDRTSNSRSRSRSQSSSRSGKRKREQDVDRFRNDDSFETRRKDQQAKALEEAERFKSGPEDLQRVERSLSRELRELDEELGLSEQARQCDRDRQLYDEAVANNAVQSRRVTISELLHQVDSEAQKSGCQGVVHNENQEIEGLTFGEDQDVSQDHVEEGQESEDIDQVITWTDESIGLYSAGDLHRIVKHLTSSILGPTTTSRIARKEQKGRRLETRKDN